MAPFPIALILSALYHESGRSSVAAGDTLAHSAGQAKPFTEFHDLTNEARDGRYLTAKNLLVLVQINGFAANNMSRQASRTYDVDCLARAIHVAEREAIEAGKVVIKLSPPRPWIRYDELPPPAQAGRRRQAEFLLSRFDIEIIDRGVLG